MANQPTDKKGNKVKFIRKNGKVIPIGSKKKESGKTDIRKRGATALRKSAQKDRELSKAGRKVGKAAGFTFLGAGLGSMLSKKHSGKLGVLAAAAGLFSVTNFGFATGRKESAIIKEQGAEELYGKKYNKDQKVRAISGAGARAERDVRMVKRLVKRKQMQNSTGF